jgi:hypothetical protein
MSGNNPGSMKPFNTPGVQMLLNKEIPIDPNLEMFDNNPGSGMFMNDLSFQMPAKAAAATPYFNQPISGYLPTLPSQSTEYPVSPLDPAAPPAQPSPANLTPLPNPGFLSEKERAKQVRSRAQNFLSLPKGNLINAKGLYRYLMERLPGEISFIYQFGKYTSRHFSVGVQLQITSAWCDARQIAHQRGSNFMVPRSVLLKEILNHLQVVGMEGFGVMSSPIRYPNIVTWYWTIDEDGKRGDGVVWPNAFGDLVLRWQRPTHILSMKSQPVYVEGCKEDIPL